MTPKQRFQILLEPDQLEALRRIETETGAPVGTQIRMAVERWLGEKGEKATKRRAATRRKV
jgi:hypothetical protein